MDPANKEKTELDTGALKAKTEKQQTRCRKVAGRYVRQPMREKLDFISLRQATKLAKKTDCPMFLGIIRATADQNVPPKKIKTKSKARAGAVHGVTEGEKRRIAKEIGPVTKDVPVTQVIKKKNSAGRSSGACKTTRNFGGVQRCIS